MVGPTFALLGDWTARDGGNPERKTGRERTDCLGSPGKLFGEPKDDIS